MKNYFIIAYYDLTEINNVQEELKIQKKFFSNKDILGRIYVSESGINGQVSLHKKYFDELVKYLSERYPKINLKIDSAKEHAFCKMTIKYRKQLVALDEEVNLSETAEHVSPQIWQKMLDEKDENTILIDVRNDYEWKVGHFKDAELPNCSSFREFPEYTKELKEKFKSKDPKVMIYCTGGIRCEFYAPLLKKYGFEKVYQLDGGIINYGHQVGEKHWLGKVFVFDDRLTVPISDKQNSDDISTCGICSKKCSTYYNCANMDCNKLFLTCNDCISTYLGCCSNDCYKSGRIREFDKSDLPKPFRKLSFEEKKKISPRKS